MSAIRTFFAHAILFGIGCATGCYAVLPWLKRNEADWFFVVLFFFLTFATGAFAGIIKGLEAHAPKELGPHYKRRYEDRLENAKNWYYKRYFASIILSLLSTVVTKFQKTPGDIALIFASGAFTLAVYYAVIAMICAKKISHELRRLVIKVEEIQRKNKMLGISE